MPQRACMPARFVKRTVFTWALITAMQVLFIMSLACGFSEASECLGCGIDTCGVNNYTWCVVCARSVPALSNMRRSQSRLPAFVQLSHASLELQLDQPEVVKERTRG